MQTDRQDLDKRYINLLCVEPHITFPPCNGSLKLTEYGFDVSYESETDCADINKTCTTIDKVISKRPEAGDGGGVPDSPLPEPSESGNLLGAYHFAKVSELDDGRVLAIHYKSQSQFQSGLLAITILDIGGSGDPTVLSMTTVITPDTSQDVYALRDIDIVTFNSDTFLIAYYSGVEKSVIVQGSISIGNVVSFDSYLNYICDTSMYQVKFAKSTGGSGLGVFVNCQYSGDPSDAPTMITIGYGFDGSSFALLAAKERQLTAYPYSIQVPVPPAYDPPDFCGGSVIANWNLQVYGFSMDFIKETDTYYLFAGGYTQRAVTNYVDIALAHFYCQTLPPIVTMSIFIAASFKIYKAGSSNMEYTTYGNGSLSFSISTQIGYFVSKRLTDSKYLILTLVPGAYKHVVWGCNISGSTAKAVRRFDLSSTGTFYGGYVYSVSEEGFMVAISNDTKIDIYSCLWRPGYFYGYFDKFSFSAKDTYFISGGTLSNERVLLNYTRYNQSNSSIKMLDIADV